MQKKQHQRSTVSQQIVASGSAFNCRLRFRSMIRVVRNGLKPLENRGLCRVAIRSPSLSRSSSRTSQSKRQQTAGFQQQGTEARHRCDDGRQREKHEWRAASLAWPGRTFLMRFGSRILRIASAEKWLRKGISRPRGGLGLGALGARSTSSR